MILVTSLFPPWFLQWPHCSFTSIFFSLQEFLLFLCFLLLIVSRFIPLWPDEIHWINFDPFVFIKAFLWSLRWFQGLLRTCILYLMGRMLCRYLNLTDAWCNLALKFLWWFLIWRTYIKVSVDYSGVSIFLYEGLSGLLCLSIFVTLNWEPKHLLYPLNKLSPLLICSSLLYLFWLVSVWGLLYPI